MTKKQIRTELKSEAKVYGSIQKGANALVNQFPGYAHEIREIEMKMLVNELLKGVA